MVDYDEDLLRPGVPPGGKTAITPTPFQKKVVDNVLSGKYKSKYKALRAAGASKYTARQPGHYFKNSKGIQLYLERLEKRTKERYGMTLRDKTVDVLTEGLDATKQTKEGEHPDYQVRKQYVDKLLELMGYEGRESINPLSSKNTQVNFFMTSKEEQEDFNGQFKRMMKKIIAED